MPKGNPGRLKSRFEIRGELVPNEHEFQQHHGEMTEQEHENFPPTEGRRSAKQSQAAAKGAAKGGPAKAAQKSAAKSSAKKSGGKGAGKSTKAAAGKKAGNRR